MTSSNIPEALVKEMENVLTIDGRGRPKKAVLLMQLINTYGLEKVLEVIKEFGRREFF